MRTIVKAGIAAGVVAVVSTAAIWGLSVVETQPPEAPARSVSTSTPTPSVTPTIRDEVTVTRAPAVEAPVEAPVPVEEVPEPYVELEPAPVVEPEPYAPVRCPAGTTPGAVAENGDESNCIENNPETDRPCVAYNDANECTAWLEE